MGRWNKEEVVWIRKIEKVVASMTGKTHRVGGMLCCLGGYTLLEANGMLLGDVNPLLQLTIMYPFAIYGSTVSDLDHHWQSAPSKDIVS